MSEFPHSLDELIEKLRQHGYRLTPQRRAVLRILAESHEHLSIEQIYDRLKQDFPMTGLATVYKTIALLKEMGVVRQINLDDGRARYESSLSAHPHLICPACRRIFDLNLDITPLAELARTIAQHEGYQVLTCRFEVLGLCPACQKKAG